MPNIGIDFIEALDTHARLIGQRGSDRDVFEFDLSLWELLSALSRDNPTETMTHFTLSPKTVKALAVAKRGHLRLLSSGILISFKLETPENEIVARFAEEYDSNIFNSGNNAFDLAYWQLLRRIAKEKGYLFAKEVFGISGDLAEKISQATDGQIRYMTEKTETFFSLRFSPSIIEEILSSEKCSMKAIFMKYQQSLGCGLGTGAFR